MTFDDLPAQLAERLYAVNFPSDRAGLIAAWNEIRRIKLELDILEFSVKDKCREILQQERTNQHA